MGACSRCQGATGKEARIPAAAQLALLKGKMLHATAGALPGATISASQEDKRGLPQPKPPNTTNAADPARPWAHPYFWAPFVLMGNWL